MARRREPRPDLIEVLKDGKEIDEALQRAGRDAIRRHKRGGVPLVTWKDGEVVHVPPEELPDLPDEPAPTLP
jgi:hypothetical protein